MPNGDNGGVRNKWHRGYFDDKPVKPKKAKKKKGKRYLTGDWTEKRWQEFLKGGK